MSDNNNFLSSQVRTYVHEDNFSGYISYIFLTRHGISDIIVEKLFVNGSISRGIEQSKINEYK